MTGWFSRYRAEDHLAEPAECSVAWLTGQSSFTHSSLSPGQLSVLDDMSGLGYRAVSCGFPYNTAALSQPYRKEHVIAASVRNGAQFIAARISRRFVGDLAQHVQPLFDTTSRRLLLLCGSCGVELLSAVLPVVRGERGCGCWWSLWVRSDAFLAGAASRCGWSVVDATGSVASRRVALPTMWLREVTSTTWTIRGYEPRLSARRGGSFGE